MYTISDLKVGTVINHDGAPYQIMKAEHSKQARSAAVLRVKMRNLATGQVLDKTFQQSDSVEPADMEKKEANFQYSDDSGFIFMDNETYDQFTLDHEAVGGYKNYIKEGEDITVDYFDGKPIGISLPVKVELKVVESPPGIKGDSASNVTKKVKLETGYEVPVPLFVKEGDKIRVNTDTGEYVERVAE
ncbi:MAG: elongation factor P [Candidatus Kerfeldbacteria bacterium]